MLIKHGKKRESITEENSDGEEPKTRIDRARKRFPRTYNLMVFGFAPLCFLIGFCFFCGYFLARLEMPKEIEENDDILQDAYRRVILQSFDDSQLMAEVKKNTEDCIDEYATNITNGILLEDPADVVPNLMRLKSFLSNCTAENMRAFEIEKFFDGIENIGAGASSFDQLSYDWIICPFKEGYNGEEVPLMERSKVSAQAVFEEQYLEIVEIGRAAEAEQKNTFKPLFLEMISEVKAHEHCVVNVSGGAFYWFTIMTTIGYGNADVVSNGGRFMVYSLGFISILLFTSVSAQAGYVSLAVAEDFFNRVKMKSLTNGFGASLFWFIVYQLLNWLVSYIALDWAWSRSVEDSRPDFTRSDAFWMAYITTTTVGFGDFYFPHEIFFIRDMFYVPLLLLVAFVALANFLIKFAEWIGKIVIQKNVGFKIVDLQDSMDALSHTHQNRRGTLKRLKSQFAILMGHEENRENGGSGQTYDNGENGESGQTYDNGDD